MVKWHAHLGCGCCLKFASKPRIGHLVQCTQHGVRPIRSTFEIAPTIGSEGDDDRG
jgi:hypothetical protein